MLREIKNDILWCYRDDRRRIAREVAGGILAIAAGVLLVFVMVCW